MTAHRKTVVVFFVGGALAVVAVILAINLSITRRVGMQGGCVVVNRSATSIHDLSITNMPPETDSEPVAHWAETLPDQGWFTPYPRGASHWVGVSWNDDLIRFITHNRVDIELPEDVRHRLFEDPLVIRIEEDGWVAWSLAGFRGTESVVQTTEPRNYGIEAESP